MWSKAVRAWSASIAGCLFVFSLASPVWAKDTGLLVERPSSQASEAPAQDAVLIARVIGYQAQHVTVAAKAEGIIEGKRVTLPLRVDRISGDRHAVTRQWPTTGVWVISLSAKRPHPNRDRVRDHAINRLVEIGADGSVRNLNRIMPRKEGEQIRFVVRAEKVRSSDKARKISKILQRLATPENLVSSASGRHF